MVEEVPVCRFCGIEIFHNDHSNLWEDDIGINYCELNETPGAAHHRPTFEAKKDSPNKMKEAMQAWFGAGFGGCP